MFSKLSDYLDEDILEHKDISFEDMVTDKERELREMEIAIPLSEYSTSQLKAELRRRKKERR